MRTLYELKNDLKHFKKYKLEINKYCLYLDCFEIIKSSTTISDEAFIDAVTCGKKLYKLLANFAPSFEIEKDGKIPYIKDGYRYIVTFDDNDKNVENRTIIINKLFDNDQNIDDLSNILDTLMIWINKYGTPWAEDELHHYIVPDDFNHAFEDADIMIFRFVDLLIFIYIVYESLIKNNYSKLFVEYNLDEKAKSKLLLKKIIEIENSRLEYENAILYKEGQTIMNNKMAMIINTDNPDDLFIKFLFEDIYDFLWYKLKGFVISHLNREKEIYDSYIDPYYKICDLCKEPFSATNNRQKYCTSCSHREVDKRKSKNLYKKRKDLKEILANLAKEKRDAISLKYNDRIDKILNLSARELKKITIKELEFLINHINNKNN